MSLTASDKIIIKDMIQQEVNLKICFSSKERKDLHRLCDNGHVPRLIQASDAIRESGATVVTLTGLLGMSVIGSNISKKLIGFLLLGILVAAVLGIAYLIGAHSSLPQLIVK